MKEVKVKVVSPEGKTAEVSEEAAKNLVIEHAWTIAKDAPVAEEDEKCPHCGEDKH